MNKFRKWKSERIIKKERAKKGYSWSDVMNIDYWFLDIITRMLQEFKEKHDGYPGQFTTEWFDANKDRIEGQDEDEKLVILSKDEALQDEMVDFCSNKWNDVIDKMIFLFNEAKTEDYNKKEYADKCLEDGMKLFTQYFHNLWY